VNEDPTSWGLVEVSDRIREGAVTSEAVTRAILDRIAADDGRLHSFLLVTADEAVTAARRADDEIARGHWRGRLHGVPIAIKDNIRMAGHRTTGGMAFLGDTRSSRDAAVVARLRDAGAVIVGKTHLTDAATTVHHPAFPRPVNPWRDDLWTGVSSSGSAVAVAAGFCYAALGTDTSGSIRLPASATNLTGIKPTTGRVSAAGIMAMSPSLDTVGPIARDIADAAAVLQVISGADPDDPVTLGRAPLADLAGAARDVDGLVVGIDWGHATAGVESPIVEALRTMLSTLSDLGARTLEIEFPRVADDVAEASVVVAAEAGLSHAHDFPARADRYGPVPLALLRAAAGLDASTVTRGYLARDRVRARVSALFDEIDLLLLPVLPRTLPTWDEMQPPGENETAAAEALRPLLRYTHVVNLAGLPAAAFPAGFTNGAVPLGLQLVGGPFDEVAVVRAVAAFQRATDFHERRPSSSGL
jgi:amidase